MKEIFKDIEGYEGLYQVSNFGRVKSLEKIIENNGGYQIKEEKILKPNKNNKGYLKVGLHQQGKMKNCLVHRLVAKAFLPNPNNLEQINHRDEDKTNNHVTNLEWCTNRYNTNYGTRNQRVGEKLSKQVLCVETGVIYPSAHQVERQLGFAQTNISSACRGKLKTAYGFHWRIVS